MNKYLVIMFTGIAFYCLPVLSGKQDSFDPVQDVFRGISSDLQKITKKLSDSDKEVVYGILDRLGGLQRGYGDLKVKPEVSGIEPAKDKKKPSEIVKIAALIEATPEKIVEKTTKTSAKIALDTINSTSMPVEKLTAPIPSPQIVNAAINSYNTPPKEPNTLAPKIATPAIISVFSTPNTPAAPVATASKPALAASAGPIIPISSTTISPTISAEPLKLPIIEPAKTSFDGAKDASTKETTSSVAVGSAESFPKISDTAPSSSIEVSVQIPSKIPAESLKESDLPVDSLGSAAEPSPKTESLSATNSGATESPAPSATEIIASTPSTTLGATAQTPASSFSLPALPDLPPLPAL